MPTYTVTDPQSGRTLDLVGDSPPSETELEEIFKASAPSLVSRAINTAKDVGVGFAKGVADTVTGPAKLLAPIINKMAASRDRRAALPATGPGTISLTDRVPAKNEDGSISTVRSMSINEDGKEILIPTVINGRVVSDDEAVREYHRTGQHLGIFPSVAAANAYAQKLHEDQAAGRFPPNASDEFLKKFESTNRAQTAGKVAEFAAETVGPAAFSRVSKFLAGRAKKVPLVVDRFMPNVSGAADGANVVDKIPYATPTTKVAATAAPVAAAAPRLAGKAPTVEDAIKAALDELRNPMATRASVSLPPSHLARTVESAAAPAFKAITQEAETHLASGNVEQAATTIEQKVKLTVAELMRVGREKYGSARAGKMLQPNQPAKVGAAQVKRLAPGASQMPTAALEDMAKRGTSFEDVSKAIDRVKGESGSINPALALHAGGAAAGAAIGATQGDTPTERATNAVAGGVMGGLTTSFIAHAAAQGVPKALQRYVYTSVLSSPGSVAKAYLGGVGGAVSIAMEKIAAGEARDGGRILQSLFSPSHVTEMVKAFRSPAFTGRTEEAPTLLGRVFEAVNAPAIRAMQRGGVSLDDAIRATLSGTPTTQVGQDVLGLWSRYFPLRLATTLFPRVGVQILERGVERSPLGLLKLKGINEGVSTGTRVARASMGTAAGLGAAAASDQVPDWAKPYVTALSATYGLPVGVGLAVGKAAASGKNASGKWMAGTQEATRNLPFPQYGPADALNPAGSLSAMLVPNILRDVARARDPEERSTAGIPFGRAKAKIPGLRETLPVKGRAVNIAGQPNEKERGPLQRFFNPAARENSPYQDVPEGVAKELRRLAIPINAPSFEKELEIGKRKIAVPPAAAERARAERRQYLIPQIEKLLDSPAYTRSDDTHKAARLKAVISRAEAAGSTRARANVIKLLRQQGGFKR